jgi:hypothetical protein
MPARTLTVEGQEWSVFPSGRSTIYGQDQYGLTFLLGTGSGRKRRFTRYAPLGVRRTDAALRDLSDRELLALFHQSQPAWTAPEGAYGAR